MSAKIKIATKIPLFIVLAAFLSCSVAGVIGVIIAKHNFRDVAKEKLVAVASARKDVISDYLESVHNHANLIAAEPRTLTAFEDFKAGFIASDTAMYQSAYNAHHKHFERTMLTYGYSDVLLIDKSGDILFSVAAKGKVTDEAAAYYAELYRKAVETTQPALFSDFKDGKAHMVVPLVMDDVAIGLLLLQIPVATFDAFLSNYDGLGKTGDLVLLDSSGIAVNHHRFPEKQNLFGEDTLNASEPLNFMGNHWTLSVNQDLHEMMGAINDMPIQIAIASLFALVGICLFGVMMARTITIPLQSINEILIGISRNDSNVKVTYTDRSDEIGDLARSALIFKQHSSENKQLEQAQRDSESRSRDERVKARRELAERFELRVQTIIQTVSSAAKELSVTAASLGELIENMNAKARNVASSSDEASHNVQSVAAAVEQMSATTREIAQQITKSSNTVKYAVAQVQRADTTSNQLEKATKSIGEIVVFIQSIAKQINLLALNATIESARAGEAGKGFAVVAGEVKGLATQTSKATEQIASDVQSIQKVSGEVVHALRSVKSSISSVDEYSSAMASAVEEQSMATNEIANNMGNAAVGTTRISGDIIDVSKATSTASNASQQVLESAKMLSTEAEKLSQEVKLFLSELRQG